jgi:uncharacterized membrane protein
MADNASETVKVKTKAGDDKVLAAVATIPLVGLIIYYAMPDASDMVKHYAKQSNAILALNLVSMLLGFTFILALLLPFLWLITFVLWVVLLVKALQGDEKFMLPVVGAYFDKLLK